MSLVDLVFVWWLAGGCGYVFVGRRSKLGIYIGNRFFKAPINFTVNVLRSSDLKRWAGQP